MDDLVDLLIHSLSYMFSDFGGFLAGDTIESGPTCQTGQIR